MALNDFEDADEKVVLIIRVDSRGIGRHDTPVAHGPHRRGRANTTFVRSQPWYTPRAFADVTRLCGPARHTSGFVFGNKRGPSQSGGRLSGVKGRKVIPDMDCSVALTRR
jgi:hypothetical protein